LQRHETLVVATNAHPPLAPDGTLKVDSNDRYRGDVSVPLTGVSERWQWDHVADRKEGDR
jgi:hypothetical protein